MIKTCCLFVNNDPADQAYFVDALGELSPNTLCFTALDGVDALYMMLEENIVPDFIFAELRMPRLDGKDFLRELRKTDDFKDIPVVIHARSPLPNEVIELKEAGASAIYLREYNHDDTRNMLSLLLSNNLFV